MSESKSEGKDSYKSEKDVKAPNIFERTKEEMEAIVHTDRSPRHHKETHGRSDDIDENTPIDEIRGPSVFERAKEEVEALVEAIHPKKETDDHHDSSSKKEDGFFSSIGRRFEKICSPRNQKRS